MKTEKVTKSTSVKTLTDLLDYSNGMVMVDDIPERIQSNPTKYNLAKQTFESISDLDGIYFSGEYPLIYFKTLSHFDPNIIRTLHKQIWNQGRVPLMFISCPHELRIYNCYDKPLKNDEDIDKIEIDRFEQSIDELARLEGVYHQSRMDSGLYWDTDSGKKIIQTTSKKVDKYLVTNLKNLRSRLREELRDKINDPIPYIHNILGRSLFILYLEDRGVISKNYYQTFLAGANEYFDVLNSKSASYDLFTELNVKFNGDIFTVTSAERRLIGLQQLRLVRDCFYGNDVLTGQQVLWRAFDFKYIPIELLSAIYEEFLHTEEGEQAISKQGAYYTPQPLVEFVLNEVLPYPDENNTDYKLKILDPACGSGIFLVEAYKRLIERWRYVHPGEKMSIDPLRDILLNSIFGIEKNSEAIKVASFSLYLTILNYLEPKYIWKSVRFPYLLQSPEREEDHQGQNLFQGDTFELTSYEGIKFDLVIGNPPWKRGNLDDSVNLYLKTHRLGNEVVLAFLHKVAFLAPKAKIALVSTAKVLFNTLSGYKEFRRFLFNETKVEAIINFAALRKSRGEIGRKLFASATGPTIVVFYNGIDIKDRKETILYCTPKPQFKDNCLTELVIDASDIKFVPQMEAADPKSKVWKVAMWGTMRDYNLIKFLDKKEKVEEFLDRNNWERGKGFELASPCDKPNAYIRTIPHLPNAQIIRYHTPRENASKVEYKIFRRLGCEAAYKAPHLLIKSGQSNKEFCATFLDYDCSFRHGVYGIHAEGQEAILKILAAYFNSKFATYYLFLTASSWGIEREVVYPNEVFELPSLDLMTGDQKYDDLLLLVDKIIDNQKQFSLNEASILKELEGEIDKLIIKHLGLKQDHLPLINNIVDFGLNFFQEGAASPALLPNRMSELKQYARKVCSNLEKLLVNSQTNFWATQYEVYPNSPLTIVAFHFNNKNESGFIKHDDITDVSTLLNKLNRVVYERHSESIYFRKLVKHYDSDTLFIVKPNQKRFWTEAMALEDSDSVALEMMSIVNG